jgi:choline-sulfatase
LGGGVPPGSGPTGGRVRALLTPGVRDGIPPFSFPRAGGGHNDSVRTLLPAILIVLFAGCDSPMDDPPPVKIHTVVLITVDTLRADHSSALGYDLDTTPRLRALADRGTRFTRCLTQHVETGPSITSMHTSRHPRETGVRANGDIIRRDLPTLAESFREAGYITGGFVSTYLLKPQACGLDRGFDVYDHEMNAPNFGHEDFERKAVDTVDRAVAWLESRAGRPAFLYVHLYDPHGPYDPGPGLARRFYRHTGRPPLDPKLIVKYQRVKESLDPDDYVARYDGEIFAADREVGRLIDALPEDALVAFTADHGEGLGENGYWFRHGSLLNRACLRTPLVLAGPGVPAGRTEDRPVANLDVAPTLLDLAGLPPLPGARGRSLLAPDGREEAIFSEARRRGGVLDRTGIDTRYKVSATTATYRFTLWPETGESRLVDLVADPAEERDVTEGFPKVADRLSTLLRRFLLLGDRLGPADTPADVAGALRGLGYLRDGGDD